MFESTNTMLKVTAEQGASFGYYLFAVAAAYFIYVMVMNQYYRWKKRKLEDIKRMIEDGHERRLREEKESE